MCGIAGEYRLQPDGAIQIDNLVPMIAALEHRGPDEWGWVVDPTKRAGLLHARLSIVDLAGGRQPLSTPDGAIWVTFNGEMYGFQDIRRELQARGHHFQTRSDTEIIVQLYAAYGEDFVDHLRGEFAFALHDRRNERFYLVRDRFGIKPLYYTEVDGGLIFGSEAKSLFCHPGLSPRLDRRYLYHFLCGILPPDGTAFEGIKQVSPGCFLKVENGRVSQHRYWDLDFSSGADPALAQADDDALVEEFRRLFDEAVRLRLHGDVEVGTYLSGGIDSAAVSLKAAEHSSHRVKAYSISFSEADYDERDQAEATAALADLDHRVVEVGPGSLAPHFARSLWHSEMPVMNAHGTAKMLLSDLAHREVKVVLTGEGSDELLAGYAFYRHHILLERVRANPHDPAARQELDHFLANDGVIGGVIKATEFPNDDAVRAKFGAYPYTALRSHICQQRIAPVLSRALKAQMRNVDVLESLANALPRNDLSAFPAMAASRYVTIKTDLANYNLNYLGDRQEMANSIEGRLPFLDHVLAEFCMGLPERLTMNGPISKAILRRAMEGQLPQAAATPKKPFMAPSALNLGLFRNLPEIMPYLRADYTRHVGVFDPMMLSLARQGVQFLPRRSERRGLWEALLIVALSIHMLNDLFVDNFDRNVKRFSRGELDFNPERARVEVPEVA